MWLKEDMYVMFLYFGVVEGCYFHNVYVYTDTVIHTIVSC